MKSFREFLSEEEKKEKKLPLFRTLFGEHSKKPKEEYKYLFRTVYGKHSDQITLDPSYPTLQKEARAPSEVDLHIDSHSKEKQASLHEGNSLSDDEHKSLHAYSRESFPINNALHQHASNKKMEWKGAKPRIRRLDGILSKSKISEDTHVYSGLPSSPEKFFKNDRSKPVTVHFPAYTSTTTEFKKTFKFTKRRPHNLEDHPARNSNPPSQDELSRFEPHHVIKLSVPKGTPGGSIRKVARHKTEEEILLHRGMHVEIHPHPTIYPNPNVGYVTVWHAKVVGHNPKEVT